MVSNQHNELKAYEAMASATGLNAYYDVYREAGCDSTQYSRFHRIYEIRQISDPTGLKRLARHHLAQAEELRVSDTSWAALEKNLSRRCKSLRIQPSVLLHRIEPACEAIEKLSFDPNGECRKDFRRILDELDQAFDRVEDEIKHLKGKRQLEARWSRYQEILQRWDEWHLSSFIGRLNSILSND